MGQWLKLFLGCTIALILLCGWLFLFAVFGIALYISTQMEAQLQEPVQISESSFLIEGTTYQLHVLFPTKIIPGSPCEVEVWVTSSDSNENDNLKITAIHSLPFKLRSKNDEATLKPIPDGNLPRPSEKFILEYDVLSMDKLWPRAGIDFSVDTIPASSVQTFSVYSVVDSSSVQQSLLVQKILWILGLIGSASVPIVVGFIFRRG